MSLDKRNIIPEVSISRASSSDGVDLNDEEIITSDEWEKDVSRRSMGNDDSQLSSFPIENDVADEVSSEGSSNKVGSSSRECDPVPDLDVLRLSAQIVNDVVSSAESQLRNLSKEDESLEVSIKGLERQLGEILREKYPDDRLKRNSSKKKLFFHETPVKSSKKADDERDNNYRTFETFPSSYKCTNLLGVEGKGKPASTRSYKVGELQKGIDYEVNRFDGGNGTDPDTTCGVGCFKPRCIQPWATSRVYLVLYSIFGILSAAYYPYLVACLSTLEKRFAFRSKVSGIILVMDEVTPLVLGAFVGYYGGRSHRPRMVGTGTFLLSVAAFLSASPYFVYGPETHLSGQGVGGLNGTVRELCTAESKSGDCDVDDQPPTLAVVFVLMSAGVLKGFGNLAFFAVGLAYMDDNSRKKDSPLYLAAVLSLRMIGPVLGYIMSAVALKFYENPFIDPGFGPEDPRWVGAWWMGFVLQGILLLAFTIPISLFPRKLPGQQAPKANEGSPKQDPNLATSLANMFVSMKRLMRNPLYIFITLNSVVAIFGHFGHFVMLPKYMESQFKLSASDAALYAGLPGVLAVIVSTILGGYLIWKFKPSARALTFGMVALEAAAAAAFVVLMIPHCSNLKVTDSGPVRDEIILEAQCNINCDCSTRSFSPVCGADGKSTFFSPCYAGCTESFDDMFFNCSCALDFFGMKGSTAQEGPCTTFDCWSQALIYIVSFPIFQAVMCLLNVAGTMILLRSVQPEDKSIALGTYESVTGSLGFIPFPIVFGALVDSSCLVWEQSCGQTGNCWLYDSAKFNYLLHGASALFCLLSACCLVGVHLLSGRMQDLYTDEAEGTVLHKESSRPSTFLNSSPPDMYSQSSL